MTQIQAQTRPQPRQAQLTPILLVEDDDIDIEAVRRALKKANVANPLFNARDGVEALEVLTGKGGAQTPVQPCVMLLDINMPRMNGFQLLKEMRQDERLKKNIVFMLTTSSRNEDKTAAYELNAAGYILKKNLHSLADMLGDYCKINEFPEGAGR